MNKSISVSVIIPQNKHSELMAEAKRKGQSLSGYIRQTAYAALEESKKVAA